MTQVKRILTALKINSHLVNVSNDDIIQNVMLNLFLNKERAYDIYINKRGNVLYTIVKREIYNCESEFKFSNKMELSRFQRIIAICTKYEIPPIPENAYKISALLGGDNGKYDFSIPSISNILSFVINNNPNAVKS